MPYRQHGSAPREPRHLQVARAGMPLTIPGMPPRTVDVLLEIRARAAEKQEAQKGLVDRPVDDPWRTRTLGWEARIHRAHGWHLMASCVVLAYSVVLSHPDGS